MNEVDGCPDRVDGCLLTVDTVAHRETQLTVNRQPSTDNLRPEAAQ